MRKIKIVEKDGRLWFYRLTLNQRIQHFLIFVSFTLLALTGLPLKFHHTAWGPPIYRLVGGPDYAPLIHRISAIVMTALFVYHLFYVLVCAWRYYIRPTIQSRGLSVSSIVSAAASLPMVPNKTDLKELWATLKYFFFITDERPWLVSHGLKEKFGYLAVFWGIPVIGISGFFLWGETFFTRYFSGHVLNFAYIAHSDEAFLASIVIFIWHIYNVHLSATVFPMGKSWLTGYMSEREMMQYHYRDYIHAMKEAGLGERIRRIDSLDELQGGALRKIVEKTLMLVMIVAVCVATFVICRVIYESVFVLGYQVVTTEPAEKKPLIEPTFLESLNLEATDNKTFFRGYRFVQEEDIADHYHRISLKVGPEETSHCIRCHGDLPHGKSPHKRAFLNMHNLYFACQVCHIRPEREKRSLDYFWYDRRNGNPVMSPGIADVPLDTQFLKLAPCLSCTGEPTVREIAAQRRTQKKLLEDIQRPELSAEAKKDVLESIHGRIAEKPVACNECHIEKGSYLPLEKIQYPEQRMYRVTNDQIIRMIEEYKEFYLPSLIE